MKRDIQHPEPLIVGDQTPGEVGAEIVDHVVSPRFARGWWICLGFSLALLGVFTVSVGVLLYRGLGAWGLQHPVGWGLAIVNFVWWVGIGHAGTFISAFLLLMSQGWRTSINRFAEAMTLMAVACAGMFPLFHLGRPWLAYWLAPYPNRMDLWPQWRSPLLWDFAAISTYGTVSFLFWYLGMVPDLAAVRDRCHGFRRKVYAILALGWRGSARHWSLHKRAYLWLAALATPLVVSVHSIVSFDFATSIVPGWHSTIFPPFFVAGAILSGFAMVVTLAIPLRKVMGLERYITLQHLENAAKLMLVTSMLVTYGYVGEIFTAWWSNEPYDMAYVSHLFTGVYAPIWYMVLFCNSVLPQFFWFRRFRTSLTALMLISLAVNLGMWGERFMIVVAALYRDFLPSSWREYWPTIWDWGIYLGTFGIFSFGMLLFLRFLPVIAASEMVELAHELRHEAAHEAGRSRESAS